MNCIKNQAGGVFIFPVDADDLISNRVVEYVNTHQDANGFKSLKGYIWRKGKKYLELSPYFGGSCNVMKLYPDELPDKLPNRDDFYSEETGKFLIENYKICWDDHEVMGRFHEEGRDFTVFPFPSTIYILGTGVNISSEDPRIKKEKGRIGKIIGIDIHPMAFIRRISPIDKRVLTKKLRKEFSI